MSQLSFASFFDQAKATEARASQRPVVIPEQTPTPASQRLTIDEARRQFVRVFKDTVRNLRRWDVFRDFITLAASELDLARIRTPESIGSSREICEKYSDSDIKNLHELFCLMVCALEAKFHDFLGAIFMELELGDDRNGQYFTPYQVQSLLARLIKPEIPDPGSVIARQGFVTVSDPASGSAGMIIAYAENLLEAGYNPSEQMYAHCVDTDPIAADMSFIQLSLLGIPAQVVTGNSLTLECSRVRYTPVYYINNFEKRLDDQRRISTMREFMRSMTEAA